MIISEGFKNLLPDKSAGAQQLLSETEHFIIRAGLFSNYENQIKNLQGRLNSAGKSGKETAIKEAHAEIVELRKEIRHLGYDFSVGDIRLVFDGFRHDDSLREGFKRLALFILDDYFLWLAGNANHIELAEILEQQITRHTQATGRNIRINGKHYLWYLRTEQELILSGADTETKEDYEQLKAQGEASSLLFLSRLKNL